RLALLELQAHVDVGVGSTEAVIGLNVGCEAAAVRVFGHVCPDASALIVVLEDDVDDTCDGIGSVKRGCAIGQDFHMVDGGRRNEGKVGGRRSAARAYVGGDVSALAIDQHQGVIGRQ